MNIITQFKVAAACISILEDRGINVRLTHNFDEIQDILDAIDKPYLTPKLSPLKNDFTEQSAFWIVLEQYSGTKPTPIGALGALFEDLGSETLRTYWPRTFMRQYGDGVTPAVTNVATVLSEQITGRVVYFGDLFIKRSAKLDASALRAVSILAQATAMSKWNPAWVYAFISDKNYRRNIARMFCLQRQCFQPQHWLIDADQRSTNEHCLYSSRAEITHLFDIFANAPHHI